MAAILPPSEPRCCNCHEVIQDAEVRCRGPRCVLKRFDMDDEEFQHCVDIVALRGEVLDEGDKMGALEREIIAEARMEVTL